MAIIVEDGTVVDGANSYNTVLEADTYFSDLNDTLWVDSVSDEDKESALIKASRYMQQKWRLQWRGSRIEAFQSLDWPRTGVPVPDFFDPFYKNHYVPPAFEDTTFVPSDYIPEEVKQCQLLLARATIDGSGASTVSLQGSVGRVTKREKVGSLEVEYMNNAEGGARQTTWYWDAEKIIEPFLSPRRGLMGAVVRS